MTRPRAATRTLMVNALARVEGEGGMTVKVRGGTVEQAASSSVRNKAVENTRSPRAQRAHHPAAMPKPPRSPRLARVGR